MVAGKVQIEKTILSYKQKFNNKRSPSTRIDCIRLFGVGVKFECVFAIYIFNKKAKKILPIIYEQVVLGAPVQQIKLNVEKLDLKRLYTWFSMSQI